VEKTLFDDQVQIPVDAETSGFINQTDSAISFVNGSRTFTIQPAGPPASYAYYIKGVRYTKSSSDDLIIADTEGLHFIYFDGTSLAEMSSFSDTLLREYVFIAIVYWDAAGSTQLMFADERHTLIMDWKTHIRLHNVNGARISLGGGLGDILADESGALDTHAEFSVEATEFWDEDINISHSARLSTANIAVYYRSGTDTSDIWRLDETDSFGVLTTGTGRAAYNELTGGSWQQTEVANNDFVLSHVFVFNDRTRKFGVIQGQADYATLTQARAGAEVELNDVIVSGLPTVEWQFLGTIIYQTSTGYANAVKSRIRTASGGGDYVDWRGQVISRSGVGGTVIDIESLATVETDSGLFLRPDGLGGVEWRADPNQTYLTGEYYDARSCGILPDAYSTQAVVTGNLYFSPFYVDTTHTFDRMSLEKTAGTGTGINLRLGIYADNGANRPGVLVRDIGEVANFDVNGTYEKDITSPTGQELAPGKYWFACMLSGSRTVRAHATVEARNVGQSSAGDIGQNTTVQGTQTYGAMPDPAPTTTLTTDKAPDLRLRA
jgi:hypothetical protein